MKFIVIVCIFFLSLNADEMRNLDNMVSGIQPKSTPQVNKALEKRVARLEAKVKQLTRLFAQVQKTKVAPVKKVQKKSKSKAKTKEVTKVHTKPKEKKTKVSQAGTYRLNRDSYIYNEADGEILDTWAEGTSFTSTKRTSRMIKITGYFVNKVWRKAEKNIWVKSENAFKR